MLTTSETTFDFIYNSELTGEEVNKKMAFGENIPTPIGDIIVIPNTEEKLNLVNKLISIKINSSDDVAEKYKEKIIITKLKMLKQLNRAINLKKMLN